MQQDLQVRKEHKAWLARPGRADFKERLVCPLQEAPVPPVRQARLDPRETKEPQAWEQQV